MSTINEFKVHPHHRMKCYELFERDKSSPMLDIRSTTRDAVALPYSYLEMIQYDPSIGILLTFAVCEIRIEGRNLTELYAALTLHDVDYIQENNAKYDKDEVPEKDPFIERIEIKPLSNQLELMVRSFNPDRESLAERGPEIEAAEIE